LVEGKLAEGKYDRDIELAGSIQGNNNQRSDDHPATTRISVDVLIDWLSTIG
jgi:hypothetical protein